MAEYECIVSAVGVFIERSGRLDRGSMVCLLAAKMRPGQRPAPNPSSNS